MLTLPSSVRIFVAVRLVNTRCGFDKLGAMLAEMGMDVHSGHLFVFVSKRSDRSKILAWDHGGFVLPPMPWSETSPMDDRWPVRSRPPGGGDEAVVAGVPEEPGILSCKVRPLGSWRFYLPAAWAKLQAPPLFALGGLLLAHLW